MNWTAALFSFLRVLAVALATAVLPYLTADEEINYRAIVIACISSFLLTVVNFLRPGEPRFGPEPKVDV